MKEPRPHHDPEPRILKIRQDHVTFAETLQLLFSQQVTGRITLVLRKGSPKMMIRRGEITFFS